MDNKQFIRFLNVLGITVKELGTQLNMGYSTIKNRVDEMSFTFPEMQRIEKLSHVPIEEIAAIMAGKKSVNQIKVPFALTKEIAWEKLRQDDDFLRLVLDCYLLGAGQRGKKASQQEINTLKKYLILKSAEYVR